ncbi:DUF6039 family protein [Actinokineospora iranica]|uniref:NIPSNAP protein n=1 Tax=Actinokineospora iranica TaxID=1271860 RepID=A0A1G6W7J6_9PSEU|nr:DUF6039 family protein [Actinokineospora iranica]SDD61683.1 hypothetical protein SAMN05216174_11447 [Actinokineospora iranica]
MTDIIERPATVEQAAPAPESFNTSNSGFVIHRSGQLRYEHRREGREFALELAAFLNKPLAGKATIVVFEELFGQQDRVHWVQHFKNPNDYRVILELVDHDKTFKDITERDRLAEDGGGNWERMFIEGTFSERVIVPQHGVGDHDEDDDDPSYFADPASHQTSVPAGELLHSGNAGVTIMRTAHCKYEFREEARQFAYEWAAHINTTLRGSASVFLFEETFGRQDRIHWTLHLKTLDDYRKLVALGREDSEYQRILRERRVALAKGGGSWEKTFVDGTIHDLVLTPLKSGRTTGF